MPIRSVLVVDDEKNLRESLAELARSIGLRVETAVNGRAALDLVRARPGAIDVVLLDLRMPEMDGIAFLTELRRENLAADVPIIVISAYDDSHRTIEAMRLGAYDYVTKPFDAGELTVTLRRALAQRESALEAGPTRGPREVTVSPAEEALIGTSPAMRSLFKQIGRVAATDATVLITGESGTGKELVARAIHAHSARNRRPFVAVNCAAIPEALVESELFGHERGAFTGADRQQKGRFEQAHGGTLLLDEVGELTLAAQVKLLRALQERRIARVGGTEPIPVDVRVVAATNRVLRDEIAAKRFRDDLFYRLRVVELEVPPLRARSADIPQLVEACLDRVAHRDHRAVKVMSEAAMRALISYGFPGNVRELQNVVDRAAVASPGEVILPEHLQLQAAPSSGVPSSLDELMALPFDQAIAFVEKEIIRRALEASGGNRTAAARQLGMNRRLLYSKLAQYGLE